LDAGSPISVRALSLEPGLEVVNEYSCLEDVIRPGRQPLHVEVIDLLE
jgi:hypothetical protein